jgi:hypothetical protein
MEAAFHAGAAAQRNVDIALVLAEGRRILRDQGRGEAPGSPGSGGPTAFETTRKLYQDIRNAGGA